MYRIPTSLSSLNVWSINLRSDNIFWQFCIVWADETFQYANRDKPSRRHKPWHPDYEKLEKIHLEKYLDKDFFADFLRDVKLQREEEAEEKRARDLKRVS